MAKNDRRPGAGEQVDLEDALNLTDRAIRAVRDYQKGQATTSFVRATLARVPVQDLPAVALATRVPVRQLADMAAAGTAA